MAGRAIETIQVIQTSEGEMIHELKTWPNFFESMFEGYKTFEVRKNDRGFDVDHILYLREYDPEMKAYLGGELYCRVSYILQGGHFGIEEGYCVMQTETLSPEAVSLIRYGCQVCKNTPIKLFKYRFCSSTCYNRYEIPF
jgi:hypothetical protein